VSTAYAEVVLVGEHFVDVPDQEFHFLAGCVGEVRSVA
jgi:hypothetical protein